MKPTIKPKQATTIHRDGTVSFWDVMAQQWRRIPARHLNGNTLATLSESERNRILAAAK